MQSDLGLHCLSWPFWKATGNIYRKLYSERYFSSFNQNACFRYSKELGIKFVFNYLLASSDLSSAYNLCKQFGPRSGPTETELKSY